ncbi:plastid division protein PDV1 [Mercurialis annua]|uniref:plastid division protein PDV1 n=1 Tax=Mercurialis annua TaxID=3986 RepID=UPI00216076BC|nr:plastid division protein PDV1 [Mercurialis annua]
MEIEEIEAVLEKIWDLHDKLSDAIHSISRIHFLNSVKNPKKSDKKKPYNDAVEDNRPGFVFFKDFRIDDDDSAIQEAKSLNGIRTALENLEDQLEFFHTVQIQQRAERDAAIARLEQSRIVLAMRLAEHHGKKYKVIEEALAFVGDVRDASRFVSPENLYCSSQNLSGGENLVRRNEKGSSNVVIKVLISSFDLVRNSLKLNHVGGILGNAAIFAVSMIAFLHFHPGAYKELPYDQEEPLYSSRNARNASREERCSFNGDLSRLDVMLARG